MSVEQAIETLQGAVKTAKGRSALSVLETELQAGGGTREKASTGDRGGFPGAKDTVRRMMAARSSAKGGGTA